MINSEIKIINGKPILFVDGKRQPACAYITYFDERSHCGDFAKEGYEIFSLCASFSGLPLNSVTGFSPLFGIFDVKGRPDYSRFDENVRQIVRQCPTAKIFPRVRISMPQWWIDEHPEEVCLCPDGNRREALFSDPFRRTGAEMLRELIAHIHASDYADHIIGYQIAGGSTEEWFHYDHKGSLAPCSEAKFNEYLATHYPGDFRLPVSVPDVENFCGTGMVKDSLSRRYLEFISYSVADTVAYFAGVVKECVQHRQIVGVFYGYVLYTVNALRGAIGLFPLLDCPDIDFFCSPGSYVNHRALGIDWAEHVPGESVKQHGKMYFLENDIRTFLSDIPEHGRPGIDPEGKYTSPLWLGPPAVDESVWAVRKAFARQITHANALWWFDMWGGWYDCPELMEEMKRSLEWMSELTLSDRTTTRSQVAVLFDEKYPFRMASDDPCIAIQKTVHDRLGNTGMTFDFFLTEDYEQSVHYSAVLIPFPAAFDTEETATIKAFLEKRKIPWVQLTCDDFDISPEDLRRRLVAKGVHCYCDSGDVVYCGNGYLAIHAAEAGEKIISLPESAEITPLTPCSTSFLSDRIDVRMKQFETLLFRVERR